jgi:hypothetical protein
MEVIGSTETSADFQLTTQRYIQETELFTATVMRAWNPASRSNDSSNYVLEITLSEVKSPMVVKNFPTFHRQEYLLPLSQSQPPKPILNKINPVHMLTSCS